MTEPRAGDEQAGPDSTPVPSVDPPRREVQRALRHPHRHPNGHPHRHPWLRRGVFVAVGGLALVLVLGGVAYFKLSGNITELDVSKLLGARPTSTAAANKLTNLKPLNILVMGVDTRPDTGEFGSATATPGKRSDTTLIVHLAGDRQSAVVVSVPRDSMTQAPSDCKDPNSSVADGPIRQWNANFNLGGPACLIRTVEGTTGIFIDHFMVVNFDGFESMVDALGSVPVCLPEKVNDPESGLNLPAGRSDVTGEQALSFVRARYNVGDDASDILRIGRQQMFLSSMVQTATSSGLLLRPDKLFRFLDAATKSLTTDPALGDLNALRGVAQSAVGLKPSQIQFVTVPNEPYPPDPQRVQWSSAADALWKSMIEDTALPGTQPTPTPTPTGSSTTTVPPALTVTPDKITVHVSNDAGVEGLAQQAVEDLRIQGFKIDGASTGAAKQGVTVGYASGNEDQARTVAAAFPGATLVQDASAGGVIRVSMGAGSANVVLVPNRLGTTPLPTHTLTAGPSASSTATIKARAADSDICS